MSELTGLRRRTKDAMRGTRPLVVRLRRRWSVEDAAVLADWCEERQLAGVARALRKGPSIRARNAVEALAACMRIRGAFVFGPPTGMLETWTGAGA